MQSLKIYRVELSKKVNRALLPSTSTLYVEARSEIKLRHAVLTALKKREADLYRPWDGHIPYIESVVLVKSMPIFASFKYLVIRNKTKRNGDYK